MKQYAIYILIPGLIGWASCKEDKTNTTNQDQVQCVLTPEFKKRIKLEVLSTSTINKELELTGSVSYDQDHIFRYQSLASGVITKVHFNIGDYVQKGQVLAEVRTAELSGQKSDLHKAEAEAQLAQRKLNATKNLHDDGVASDRDVMEAVSSVTAAQSEIDRIKETLALQGSSVEKGLLVIRAPLSGYVVEKKITNGYQVDAGEDDLFVLSDLKRVWVQANVYAAQLDMVKVGQKVAITTTAYPGKRFEGKISRLSHVFDAEERVLKAIIEIDNQDLRLKPSMMVSVNVDQPGLQQATCIPKDAVVFADNAYYILRYKGDCGVKAIPITPVADDRKCYYIDTNKDIGTGDTIISENQLLIYNKLKER